MIWTPGHPPPEKATDSVEYLRSLYRYDPLTGDLFFIDPNRRRFGQRAGYTSEGRRKVMIDGREYKFHRVAWIIYHGRLLDGFIDHINGNALDNRIANLREASPRINGRNTRNHKNNTSGCAGVYWDKCVKRWIAGVNTDQGRRRRAFRTREEAIACRKAAEALHGYHPNHGRVTP